ncbi:MAG: alanine--tRNA ligase-related protein, partial [Bradymonadaceae bacterium]
ATGEEAAELIRLEEERFLRNIDRGIELFEEAARRAEDEGREELRGEEVFELHATYGFPPDLTEIMAEERDLQIDWAGYESHWEEHQRKSKSDDEEATIEVGEWTTVRDREHSQFVGYDESTDSSHDPHGYRERSLETETAVVRYRETEEGYDLVLDKTPFYAESGGQVGDRGRLEADDGSVAFHITDTQETDAGVVHRAELQHGDPTEDNLARTFHASVDARHRRRAASNHTATHLLHYVLRDDISDSIFQSGSLVAPDRLRFDFSHDEPLTRDQLQGIEDRINRIIQRGVEVGVHPNVDREEAVEEMGAMAIFGEEYGDIVRVVEVTDEEVDLQSVELCGGTHVENTRDLNLFRITSESGVAAGIRRIEAVTGERAYEEFQDDRLTLEDVADVLKTDVENARDSAESLVEEKSDLERRADRLAQKLAALETSNLADSAEEVAGVPLVASTVDVETRDELRTYADRLRNELESGVGLLAAEVDHSAALVCLVTDDLVEEPGLNAGSIVSDAAQLVGGGGGGRPTMAQAGGPDANRLSKVIDAAPKLVAKALGEEPRRSQPESDDRDSDWIERVIDNIWTGVEDGARKRESLRKLLRMMEKIRTKEEVLDEIEVPPAAGEPEAEE